METANKRSTVPGRKARVPLSCGQCRYRKLKCNRQQPCQNCIMRKEPSACVFVSSEKTNNASARSHAQAENMQDRIDRLETVISSLVSKNSDQQDKVGFQEIAPVYNGSSQLQDENKNYSHEQLAVDSNHLISVETTLQRSLLEPDESEANELIQTYQNETANQSPFVILPPGTTASDLRRKSPLLYNAVILATSSHHPARQTFYEKQIVEVVTDQLLIRNNKSLELLQSILLVITWYQRPAFIISHLNSLLQLAVALVMDLNLNRSPTWFVRSKMVLGTPCSRDLQYGPKTMDDRRALLGCFYLSSAASTCSFQRLDSMRLTSQIEESCQALVEKAENPTDLQLVYVVKAQYLTDRIVQTVHANGWDSTLILKTPVGMHIKAFQSEIATMKESLPPLLQHNTSVLMHLDFASMRLYEVALLDDPQNMNTNTTAIDPARLENLYSLLLSLKSFITAITTSTGPTHLSLCYITWAQFTYALMLLHRLTFFKSSACPSWDVPFVRSVLDFSVVLDAFASRFEQARIQNLALMAPGEAGLRAEQEQLFDRHIKKMQLVRAWAEHKIKFGDSASWDWTQEKRKLADQFEGKEKDGGQSNALASASMGINSGLGLQDGEMQLDQGPIDGLNDDSFWLEFAAEWGEGLGLYSNDFFVE